MSASDACLPPSGPPADPAAGEHEGAPSVQRPADAAPTAAGATAEAPTTAAASQAPSATAAGQQPRGGGGPPAGQCGDESQASLRMLSRLRGMFAPPEQRVAVAELERVLSREQLDPQTQQAFDQLMHASKMVEKLEGYAERLAGEAEDALQPPQMPAPPPGAEYLLARLHRAAALPPADRSPEVAAFVETAQLCHEVCEVLPLAPSGRPALPSLDFARVGQAIELGLAKLWRGHYLLPFGCCLASDANPWPAVQAYLEQRTPSAEYNLMQAIMAGKAPGSAGASSSSSASTSSDGSGGSSMGPYGVPIRSALRLALLCIAWSRAVGPALPAARLLRAADDIAADPACSAAIAERLAALSASQPVHHGPLLLTAQQLRCVACTHLALLEFERQRHPSHPGIPAVSMTPAEIEEELHSANRAGMAGLLALEPHEPRTLLHAAMSELTNRCRAPPASVEGCLRALRMARQQGALLTEVHAICSAFSCLLTLLAGRDGAGGSGPSNAAASGTGSSTADSMRTCRRSKASGAGAGAARRQQRRAGAELQQLLEAQQAAAASVASLPLATIDAALEAFSQAGEALKAAKALLPEGWVRPAAEEHRSMQPLAAAVQRLVEESRRRGEASISAGCRGMQALVPAAALAVRSGNVDRLNALTLNYVAEMDRVLPLMASAVHLRQDADSATPRCSGCGAAAVGLRKCAACKKAQYCSRECQTAHWRHHKVECSGRAG